MSRSWSPAALPGSARAGTAQNLHRDLHRAQPCAGNLARREITPTSPDYFATRARTDRWEFEGQQAEVTFWDRPLSEMLRSFLRAGFTLADLREPGVSPAAKESFPELFAEKDDPRFLAFLFLELRR